ncbi:hypothetical protein [Phocaeicola sp.]|uniref:hypothetical protein n=1 Tax=Phocaeicola sp. TaxID=2773926 RepID=UPI003A8D40FD
MKYDIKPDYQIKFKRKCLSAFTISLFLVIQAVRVLWDFSSNENWKNIVALIGGLGCLIVALVALWKYRKLIQKGD